MVQVTIFLFMNMHLLTHPSEVASIFYFEVNFYLRVDKPDKEINNCQGALHTIKYSRISGKG